jgi:hypothetical protein
MGGGTLARAVAGVLLLRSAAIRGFWDTRFTAKMQGARDRAGAGEFGLADRMKEFWFRERDAVVVTIEREQWDDVVSTM